MQFKPAENSLSCSHQVIKAVANVLPRNFIIPEAQQLRGVGEGVGKGIRDEGRKQMKIGKRFQFTPSIKIWKCYPFYSCLHSMFTSFPISVSWSCLGSLLVIYDEQLTLCRWKPTWLQKSAVAVWHAFQVIATKRPSYTRIAHCWLPKHGLPVQVVKSANSPCIGMW